MVLTLLISGDIQIREPPRGEAAASNAGVVAETHGALVLDGGHARELGTRGLWGVEGRHATMVVK